jgi:hypothetical protein
MAGDGDGIERVYRRRRRLPWRYLGLMGVVFVNAIIQVSRTSNDPYTHGWTSWGMVPLMVAALVRIALEQFRAHTRVTAVGVTAQGPVRSRTWAWHEVYDIRVEPAPRGSGRLVPQWLTYLYDLDGRRYLLPHLNDWQLDDPHTEVSELCVAAAPYRSLPWERRPQVEERILWRAGRRRAWTWAAYSMLVVLFAMVAVDVWQVVVGRPEHPLLLLVVVPLASFAVLGAVLQWCWTNRAPARPPAHP